MLKGTLCGCWINTEYGGYGSGGFAACKRSFADVFAVEWNRGYESGGGFLSFDEVDFGNNAATEKEQERDEP